MVYKGNTLDMVSHYCLYNYLISTVYSGEQIDLTLGNIVHD